MSEKSGKTNSVTIYDVARHANLSGPTVSRALGGNSRISDKTKKKVFDVAQKLGYRPNSAGKILKTGKTNTIGVMVPDLTNPYFVEFLRAVEQNCLRKGYRPITVEYMQDASQERYFLEQVLERRCDGIIAIISRCTPLKDLFEEFWFHKIPCVIHGLAPDINSTKMDGTKVDMAPGVQQAVDHLVDLGHKEIVLVASWREEFADNGRLRGFQEAFLRHGLGSISDHVLQLSYKDHMLDGICVGKEILRTKPKTTAIIGTNDMLTIGIAHAMLGAGIRVPAEMSLISMDNTWLAKNWSMPLTSIDQKTKECAFAATEILFGRLENQEWGDPIHVEFSSHLVVRESTKNIKCM
jgi:LacI family transcriptional regulator